MRSAPEGCGADEDERGCEGNGGAAAAVATAAAALEAPVEVAAAWAGPCERCREAAQR